MIQEIRGDHTEKCGCGNKYTRHNYCNGISHEFKTVTKPDGDTVYMVISGYKCRKCLPGGMKTRRVVYY